MKPLDIKEIERFDICELCGHPYMFTNMRVDRQSIPQGLYAYDVRDSDDCDGSFAQIKEKVWINHWGTIIGLEPITLDVYGSFCPEEADYDFVGEYLTLAEYLQYCQTYQGRPQ